MTSFKASPVFLHISAWLLFMTVPLLFMNQNRPFSALSSPVAMPYLQFCALYMAVFYLHTELLIPRFFLRKKYTLYYMTLLLLLGMVYVIKPFDRLISQNRQEQNFPDRRSMGPPPDFNKPLSSPPGRQHPPLLGNQRQSPIKFDITGIFIFLMIIGLGSAMQSMKQWQLYEKRAIIAEAQKATAELSFLKAQINPHFLYNTLNNIYTLCITGSENAAESIMKLSKIMRYVTDESEADFVPLQDEIDCISNFIALQQLRLGKTVRLNYTVAGDPSSQRITPLILMTFIENAFKYGLSNRLEATIDIAVKIEAGKIVFSAKNQIFDRKEPQKRNGIGIENTKRRLEHLYPNAHSLIITAVDGFFSVLLIMDSK